MDRESLFLRRLVWITAAIVVVAVAWQLAPLLRQTLEPPAEPRLVAARGDLADD
jgi:hypothetical protein